MVNFSSAEKSTRLIKDIFEGEIKYIIKISYHLFMVFQNHLEETIPNKSLFDQRRNFFIFYLKICIAF